MPLPLAKAKNGQKHSYAKKKILTTKKVGIMQHGPCFFSFREGGGLGFLLFLLCFHCFPIKFPLSSQHVPNSSSIYLIFFVINYILENLYIQPKRGGYHISIFWDCPKLEFFWVFLMGQTKMSITFLKKNFEGSHN